MDPVDPAARADARSGAARLVSRGLPPPRLPAIEGRLHGEDRPARPARSGRRQALRRGRGLAGRLAHARRSPLNVRMHTRKLGPFDVSALGFGLHEPVARLRHAAAARGRRGGAARGARRRLHPRRHRGALRVRRQRDADRRRAGGAAAGVRARQQVRHVPQRPGAARDRRPARGDHAHVRRQPVAAQDRRHRPLLPAPLGQEACRSKRASARWPGWSRPARCGRSA